MSLVAYESDDETDAEQTGGACFAPGPHVAAEAAHSPSSPKPASRNEWLSYVYIPVPIDTPHFKRLLRQLRHDAPHVHFLETFHISLTRPLVLRRHDQSTFFQQAHVASRPFAVAFCRFVSLPSDTSQRTFLALEVSAGWHELLALAEKINTRLRRTFRTPPYYTAPRFHVSLAYTDAAADVCSRWNALFQDEAVRIGPLWIESMCAQFGDTPMHMALHETSGWGRQAV